MFWQPAYLERSEWLEHLPFLFWLVEAMQPSGVVTLGTQQGVEHLALCQAVSRLGLDSRCHLVQSRKGLDQQKQGGGLESLIEYNEQTYGAFADVVDCSPVKAAGQFDDGSVDLLLLNIDSDEAEIEYVFERWHSKLSPQGVVLIPSVSRRDPGYNAFREFDALLSRFPGFAFQHGGGLGLIMVGGQPGDMLTKLLGSDESPSAQQVVRDVFARLGRTCQDAFSAREHKKRADELTANLESQKLQLDELSSSHEENLSSLQAREHELQDVKQRLDRQVEHHAHERGQLAERVTLLQEFRDEMKGELASLRARLEEQQRRQADSSAQASRLQEENHANLLRLQSVEQALSERQDELERLTEELQQKRELLDEQAERIQALEAQLAQSETTRAEQESRCAELESQLSERNAALDEARAEHAREQERLESQLKEYQAALESAEAEHKREKGRLENLLSERQAEHEAAEAEHVSQRESLEQQLNEQQQAAEIQEQHLKSKDDELNNKQREIDDRFEELATLTRKLEENEKERNELRRLNKEQEANIDERFRELATLTRMLEDARKGNQSGDEASETNTASRQGDNRPELYTKARKSRKDKAQIKRHRQVIASSRLFDAEWYLNQYPDVANDPATARDPARHYLLFGGYEGRNPGPGFDSSYYLSSNEDVRESGMNPLLHYVKFGEAEQRRAKPQ